MSRFARSRVFQTKRPRQSLLARVEGTHQRRKVCLLSEKAALNFENWGISQSCVGSFHFHIKREEVEGLVANGEVRWVGKGMNVAAFRGTPKEPDKKFQQAHAMWRIAFEDKHQECQGGLVSPR